MKKNVKILFFIAFILCSVFYYYNNRISMIGCELAYNDTTDVFLCRESGVVIYGVLSFEIRSPNVFIHSVYTYDRDYRICYTNVQYIYVYNYINGRVERFGINDFLLNKNKEYKLSTDFFEMPSYYNKHIDNCLRFK